MTIRIPKRVLYAAVAVIVLAVVGAGGYVVGRHSRADVADQVSRLQRRDKAMAADELVLQRKTAQLLIDLCREVVQLTPEVGYFDPTSCNAGALVYMPNGAPMTREGFERSNRQGVEAICADVARVEGPNQRDRCPEGF